MCICFLFFKKNLFSYPINPIIKLLKNLLRQWTDINYVYVTRLNKKKNDDDRCCSFDSFNYTRI